MDQTKTNSKQKHSGLFRVSFGLLSGNNFVRNLINNYCRCCRGVVCAKRDDGGHRRPTNHSTIEYVSIIHMVRTYVIENNHLCGRKKHCQHKCTRRQEAFACNVVAKFCVHIICMSRVPRKLLVKNTILHTFYYYCYSTQLEPV